MSVSKDFFATTRRLLELPPLPAPDGIVAFRSLDLVLVPEVPGVYLINDLRGALYAGQSNDLRARGFEHIEAERNDRLKRARRAGFGQMTFSWIAVANPRERDALERQLILWLRPPCNAVVPGGCPKFFSTRN
jgi:excinuclease UvrABC nuclease subunit